MEIKRINRTESSLVIDLFNQYRVFYKQPSNLALAKDYIQARLDHSESVIFVALTDDAGKQKPVGFTQLYPQYSSVRALKYWILNDLYVDAEYRKQGVGESLIKAALNFAKENNARFVELSTGIDNFTAQKLYEQIGFEKQNPDTDYLNYRISLV